MKTIPFLSIIFCASLLLAPDNFPPIMDQDTIKKLSLQKRWELERDYYTAAGTLERQKNLAEDLEQKHIENWQALMQLIEQATAANNQSDLSDLLMSKPDVEKKLTLHTNIVEQLRSRHDAYLAVLNNQFGRLEMMGRLEKVAGTRRLR